MPLAQTTGGNTRCCRNAGRRVSGLHVGAEHSRRAARRTRSGSTPTPSGAPRSAGGPGSPQPPSAPQLSSRSLRSSPSPHRYETEPDGVAPLLLREAIAAVTLESAATRASDTVVATPATLAPLLRKPQTCRPMGDTCPGAILCGLWQTCTRHQKWLCRPLPSLQRIGRDSDPLSSPPGGQDGRWIPSPGTGLPCRHEGIDRPQEQPSGGAGDKCDPRRSRGQRRKAGMSGMVCNAAALRFCVVSDPSIAGTHRRVLSVTEDRHR